MAAEAASPELSRTSPPRSTRRDLLDLAVGYTLIMATIWTVNPTQRILYWLAFAWIIATTWARRDGWTALGLGRKGLLQSLWIVGVALLLSAAAIFIAWRTHTLHSLHGPTPIFCTDGAYIVWSIMQQFLLQSYFLLRLLRLLPGKTAPILAATGIFALAHLPNPILTPITLVWGAIACVLFLRYRNIYTLGLAHGIMGLCVAVDRAKLRCTTTCAVGLGYLRTIPAYRIAASPTARPHHRSQSDQSVSTDACVIAEAPTLRS